MAVLQSEFPRAEHTVHIEDIKGSDQETAASALLAFEGAVRDIRDDKELLAHFCNAPRRFLRYRQSFVVKRRVRGGQFLVRGASSIAIIDRNAPLIRWIEKLICRLDEDGRAQDQCVFCLPAYCEESDEETQTYPFREFLWTPLKDGDALVGGYLTARETPWTDADQAMSTRFANLYGHAWRAIQGQGRLLRHRLLTRKRLGIAVLGLLAISMVPVPITALAPVEVVPKDPFVVAAPFDGVVKGVLVEPGASVTSGQDVIAFEDVQLRNEFDIADESEAVAEARYLRASQSAIRGTEAKRELAVAKAEYELAKAEKRYAKELLEKTILTAEQDGLVVYTDKRDWIGRPVKAGEAILQIADPQHIELSADLAVKDSLVLGEGARVKVFLDSDPLDPIEGELERASYEPRVDKRNILSYRLSAAISASHQDLPRIGVQGTAQIYGQTAPLIYSVLRRPLASFRQLTGW